MQGEITVVGVMAAIAADGAAAALWLLNAATSLVIALYCVRALIERNRASPLWLRLGLYLAAVSGVCHALSSPEGVTLAQIGLQAGVAATLVYRFIRLPAR